MAPVVACSLDEGGFGNTDGPDGGSLPDGSLADARLDGAGDGSSGDAAPDSQPNPCPTGDPGKCTAFPKDWTPVGYRDDGSNCATGFDALAQVTSPLGGGSCTCTSAFDTTGLKCPANVLNDVKWDNVLGGGCAETVPDNDVDLGDGCYRFASNHSMYHFQASPPPTAAKCTIRSAPNNASVTAKAVKICTSQIAACRGTLCAQPNACIMRKGMNNCPDGFDDRRLVGSGVLLQCAACNGTYAATCEGTTTLFTNDQCSGTGDTAKANRACGLVDGGPKSYRSLRYAGDTLVSESCAPSGSAPTPTRDLADVQTICCKD